MSYTVHDFFIGFSDGKSEALYKDNFDLFFYDFENIVSKALKPNIYIILGRKGTGKSLLGEYLTKTQRSSEKATELISFREIRVTEFHHLKSNDTPPNEYIPIWTWILLIQISKLLVKMDHLTGLDKCQKLTDFLQKNGYSTQEPAPFSIDLDRFKQVEADHLVSTLVNSERDYGDYMNYISDLHNSVLDLLSLDKSKEILLILDELDDRFSLDTSYSDVLISLIKAADYLNTFFTKNQLKTKILLLLRSDIFVLLNDTDLNKIRQDKSILINWGNKGAITPDNPLLQLIYNRVKTSVPELSSYSTHSMFEVLFPNPGTSQGSDRYILDRSLFRPRDIVMYLTKARDAADKTTKAFEGYILRRVERQYSEYLYDEIRNEMKGHFSDETIESMMVLLKKINKRYFTYQEVYQLEKQKRYLTNIDINGALEALFNFCVIGNRSGGKWTWKFRNERESIDIDQEFALHMGLQKRLLQM